MRATTPRERRTRRSQNLGKCQGRLLRALPAISLVWVKKTGHRPDNIKERLAIPPRPEPERSMLSLKLGKSSLDALVKAASEHGHTKFDGRSDHRSMAAPPGIFKIMNEPEIAVWPAAIAVSAAQAAIRDLRGRFEANDKRLQSWLTKTEQDLLCFHGDMAEQCRIFDFGVLDAVPDKEYAALSQYGFELLRNKLFQLPYGKIVYVTRLFNRINVDALMFCSRGKKIETGHPSENSFGFLTHIFLAPLNYSNATAFGPLTRPWSVTIGEEDFVIASISSVVIDVPVIPVIFKKSKPEIAIDIETLATVFTNGAYRYDRDFMKQTARVFIGASFDRAVALTAMLASKNVSTREIRPYRARADSAVVTSRIPTVHEVIVKVDGKVYKPNGLEEHGTHASPRLHWRLPSGGVINVKPCLVGSPERGIVNYAG